MAENKQLDTADQLIANTDYTSEKTDSLEKLFKSMSQAHQQRYKSLTTGLKAKIMKALKSGWTFTAIGATYHVTKDMIALIANDPDLKDVLAESSSAEETKKALAAKFFKLSDIALNFITIEKLEKMTPEKLAWVAAVALDKGRLLHGESTANISFRDMAQSTRAQLAELTAKKRELMQVLEMKQRGGVYVADAEHSSTLDSKHDRAENQ